MVYFSGQIAQQSSLSALLFSMLVLLLSWLVGIATPVVLSLLLTYAGQSMTWYCHPYLLLPLYAAPSLLGIGLVHVVARRRLLAKVWVLQYICLFINRRLFPGSLHRILHVQKQLKQKKIEKDPYKDTLIQASTKSGLDWIESINRRLWLRVCMRVDPI